ncbi:33 kDa ribonucleoprotein, chloroplastic [Lactuca sativa]|uniref:33 kDa ribonucleoprotein, chloroplastic n=1 Tax=Lactuca sativa TaxID=4236 RepID=UPI0022AF0655|nr:33 kDa ribonucleoprotein, chloroplastic [Lactuca sativa]
MEQEHMCDCDTVIFTCSNAKNIATLFVSGQEHTLEDQFSSPVEDSFTPTIQSATPATTTLPTYSVLNVLSDPNQSQRGWGKAGRLYIRNLPYAITSAELSQIFVEAGDVISVEIVYDSVTDRSRGFTFITMASVQEPKEAIRMFNGSQISGRTVKVNFPEVPRGGEREVMGPNIRSSNRDFIGIPHKIYADNLSWIITSKKLKDTFDEQPGFLSAMVIYEKQSGKSQGFGFVTFSSPEAAEYALNAMNGLEVEGRPLRLNLAEGKRDVSHSTRTGRSSEINVDGSEILSSISS